MGVIVTRARALQLHFTLPLFLWGHAVLYSVQCTNVLPTISIENDTPYRIWHKRHPEWQYFSTFGCTAYAYIPAPRRADKFASRAMKCMYIGVANNQRGYGLLNIDTHYTLTSRDVRCVDRTYITSHPFY